MQNEIDQGKSLTSKIYKDVEKNPSEKRKER